MLLGLPAFGQEYHSNDLTPAGSNAGKLSATSGGKQAGGADLGPYNYSHAVLLSGNALSAVDLHPLNYYYSMATCMDDSQQGGWGYSYSGSVHALVWNGSSSSYADLNPSGYTISYCLGVHNGEQVGYAQNQSYFVTTSHAMCWHGSAGSAIDLHPTSTTYPFSRAMGCRDGEQVGYVSTLAYPDGESTGYHTTSRAVRWTGSAASAVDLHPVGYDASEALCTSGTQQGGWGYIALDPSHMHALLWNGTADSVVDLHPAGYNDTKITAITPTKQVGEGWVGTPGAFGSVRHALTWSRTADSVIDLNQYLPAGYTNAVATGLDADGNVVGYAYNTYAAGLSIPPNAVAVVFAPGAAPAAGLSALTLSPSNVAPGDQVQVQVSLSDPAPVGGLEISFLSIATNLLATPGAISINEGETNAAFLLQVDGAALTVPATAKLYATDGTTSRAATVAVTPVVKLASLTGNPVEGGFSTFGTLSLSIPAQAGGAVVTLRSSDPSLAALPASVTVPLGYTSASFAINTAPVSVTTSVPITADLNGQTVSGSVTLSPAPVIALTGLSFPDLVGGNTLVGTITLNNFPREAAGAVISLTSADPAIVQVPATVTVPRGSYSVTFVATTTVVDALKAVSIKASYNGGSLTSTMMVNPIPTVVITQADYVQDIQMLKIQATTTFTNAVLTYGTDPNGAPIGTMQLEQGVYKGSIVMATAPTQATVWNSAGGSATVAVSVKTGVGGNSSSTGTGGTTTTTAPKSSYKIATSTNGKGTIKMSPTGPSFAAGTVVTLTATPDAGSPWIGWSGDASGTARTISVTVTRDMKVTANFR